MIRHGGADFVRASADDDTNGVIVGGFVSVGRLYYEGRPQSQQFYAANDGELQAMAADRKRDLLADNTDIYRTDGWELRILQ